MSGSPLRKRGQRLKGTTTFDSAMHPSESISSNSFPPSEGASNGIHPDEDDGFPSAQGPPAYAYSHKPAEAKVVEDSWFDLPIAFALIPAAGSLLTGSDILKDFLHLAFLLYYLHVLIKWPWNLYQAARERRPAVQPNEAISEEAKLMANLARSELHVAELLYLSLTVIAPFLGAVLLRQISSYLSIDVVSNFSISLFVLATGVKPWRHLIHLLTERTEALHTMVHYPKSDSATVALEARLSRLESDIILMSSRLSSNTTDIAALTDDMSSLTNLPARLKSEELVTKSEVMAMIEEATKQAIRQEHSSMSLESRLHGLEEGVTNLVEALRHIQRSSRLEMDDYDEKSYSPQIIHRLSSALFGSPPPSNRNKKLKEKAPSITTSRTKNTVVYEDHDDGHVAVQLMEPMSGKEKSDQNLSGLDSQDDISSASEHEEFFIPKRRSGKTVGRKSGREVRTSERIITSTTIGQEEYNRALLDVLVDNIVVAALLPLRLIRSSATLFLGRLQ
ncbi:hypothetical protein FRC02_008558 [Tulasnella sp. 418]|nr:hypothetical protein FRC02_008558 [Tulasnella sp. 418]